MFDHGLGHIVPRDAENARMLANILEKLIPELEGGSRRQKAKTGSGEDRAAGEASIQAERS
jgi:hypothetical protein